MITKLSDTHNPMDLINHVFLCDIFRCFEESHIYHYKRNLKATHKSVLEKVSKSYFSYDTAMINTILYEKFDFDIRKLPSDLRIKLLLIKSFQETDYTQSCKLLTALGWGKWLPIMKTICDDVNADRDQFIKFISDGESDEWCFIHEVFQVVGIRQGLINDSEHKHIRDIYTEIIRTSLKEYTNRVNYSDENREKIKLLYKSIKSPNYLKELNNDDKFTPEEIKQIELIYHEVIKYEAKQDDGKSNKAHKNKNKRNRKKK